MDSSGDEGIRNLLDEAEGMCRVNNKKIVKNTSWRCKICPELPPLCPGPCFAKYHKIQ